MRHRLAGAILALALGARPGVAQAPLTPIDSAILNSQPLKRLVQGVLVADVIAIMGSMDFILGDVDR